jgi:O-antigen/teichoic acid export membrane protein
MDQPKRLFFNSVINGATPLLNTAVVFLLTPFILAHLGQELYGIWMLTGSMLAYGSILSLGMNSAVNLHIPRMADAGDLKGGSRVVSTAFFLYLGSAFMAGLFAAVVVWKFPLWFNIERSLWGSSRWVVALLGAGMVLGLPLAVFSAVLSGLQRYELLEGPHIAFLLLRAAAIVVAFSWLGEGIVFLAAISVATALCASALIAWLACKKWKTLTVAWRLVEWSMLPGMLTYGLSTLLFACGQIIQLQSGKVLTGLLFDPETVTEFAVPFMLLSMVAGVVHHGVVAVKPAVTLMAAQDKHDAIRKTFLLSTKYALMIAVPTGIVCMMHGETILRAWLGEGYSGQGGRILFIMAIPQMLWTANLSGFYGLAGLGKHRLFGLSVIIRGAVAILLGYILAGPAGMGVLGIAWGYALPELLASGLVMPWHSLRTLKVPVRALLLDSILPAGLAALPFLVYSWSIPWWSSPDGRVECALVFGLSALPWMAGVWFLGLAGTERSRFRAYLLPFVKKPLVTD